MIAADSSNLFVRSKIISSYGASDIFTFNIHNSIVTCKLKSETSELNS